jgi:hypothetical protein
MRTCDIGFQTSLAHFQLIYQAQFMNEMPARPAVVADLLRKGNANGGMIVSGANLLHRRNKLNSPVRKIGPG